MTRTTRFACLVLPLPVLLVAAVSSRWVRAAGLDFWNTPALHRQLAADQEQRARLTAATDEVRARSAIKKALLDDLFAGRTTLRAVTEQFLLLGESDPSYLFVIRHANPGRSDAECAARNVIACVIELAEPVDQDDIRRRMEAELRAMTGGPTDALASVPGADREGE